MPPLADISDDEDDEPLFVTNVSAHSHCNKTHNKIPLHDRTILENVQAKIHDCSHQLSLSPDHLEETECTIEECHMAINKIKAKHSDLKSLQDTAITLLGNLEAWWLTLSSLAPDDQPLEYLTGKI